MVHHGIPAWFDQMSRELATLLERIRQLSGKVGQIPPDSSFSYRFELIRALSRDDLYVLTGFSNVMV